MKKLLLCSLFLFSSFLLHNTSSAQVNNAGQFLRAGIEDANLLLENYLQPYASGFSAGLNTGWNNSARPYGTLGFDVRVSATLAFVPSSDEMFDVADLKSQFTQLKLLSSSGLTPTVAGDHQTTATVGRRFFNPSTGLEEELFSFDLPKGTGYPLVPAPIVQGTLGLLFDTEISLRVVPPVKSGRVDGRVSMYGAGLKHGLNQWIPGGAVLPIDFSLQAGFTQFNFDIDTDVQPDSGEDIRNDFDSSEWNGQQVELKSSGYTVNFLVGRNLPVISLFAGIGFQNSTTEIEANGSYPITIPNPEHDSSSNSETKAIETIVDPVSISIDGSNSIHALAGFRVRFGFLTLSGSYTISNYPVANVGVGISMR